MKHPADENPQSTELKDTETRHRYMTHPRHLQEVMKRQSRSAVKAEPKHESLGNFQPDSFSNKHFVLGIGSRILASLGSLFALSHLPP